MRVKVRRDLEIERCGNQLFSHSNQTEVTIYNITNYMCLKTDNYSLQGDFYS